MGAGRLTSTKWKIPSGRNDAVSGCLHIYCHWHASFSSPASKSRSLVSAHRACLELPFNFARGIGIGPGAAAFKFGYQALNFISLRTIRSTKCLVTFMGISRTGLTTNMARQITRTIAFLPTNTITGPGPVLEMKKVVARAP